MQESCEHYECMEVLNMAAWIADADGVDGGDTGVSFVDLARSEPALRPFSHDCCPAHSVVYAKHKADGSWFMIEVGKVTRVDLLRRLEQAVQEEKS